MVLALKGPNAHPCRQRRGCHRLIVCAVTTCMLPCTAPSCCAHLAGLLLVQLGAGLLDLAHDMRHARLVAHEGGQVAGLAGVVPGEGLALALAAPAALLGQEAQRPMPRVCAGQHTIPVSASQLCSSHTTPHGRGRPALDCPARSLCCVSSLSAERASVTPAPRGALQKTSSKRSQQRSRSGHRHQYTGFSNCLSPLQRAAGLNASSTVLNRPISRRAPPTSISCTWARETGTGWARHSRSNFLCDMAARTPPCSPLLLGHMGSSQA